MKRRGARGPGDIAYDGVWTDEFLINMSITLPVRPDEKLKTPPPANICQIVNEWPSQ